MSRGFTLIELIMVVAIIGILAAIAYPNYVNHVQRSIREEAKSALLSEASAQQRFFTNNNQYNNGILTAVDTEHGHYKLTITRPDNFSYTLTATAQGNQVNDLCGNFTITHAGAKGVTGSRPVSECW